MLSLLAGRVVSGVGLGGSWIEEGVNGRVS